MCRTSAWRFPFAFSQLHVRSCGQLGNLCTEENKRVGMFVHCVKECICVCEFLCGNHMTMLTTWLILDFFKGTAEAAYWLTHCFIMTTEKYQICRTSVPVSISKCENHVHPSEGVCGFTSFTSENKTRPQSYLNSIFY